MKTCLVTGGSRGLGREILLAFARDGYSVAFCYVRDQSAAVETRRALAALNLACLDLQCDVSSSVSVSAMFASLRRAWDRLDVLVNNAGIARDTLLARQSPDDWQSVVDTNLSGSFYCMREAARWMVQQGGGQIISVSSISGIQGRAGQTAYSASKAGLIGLTKSAAQELGAQGIAVNAVLPGLLPTAMTGLLTRSQSERQMSRAVLGRLGDPEEVASFVLRLAQAKTVSGQVFNLDNRIA